MNALLPKPTLFEPDEPQGRSFLLPAHFSLKADGLEDLVAEWTLDCSRLHGISLQADANDQEGPHLVIECAAPNFAAPRLDDDTTYKIEISTTGIKLTAPERIGVFYGLQTLLQLGKTSGDGLAFPLCRIEDGARFGWRGINLDVARHFMPITLVRRMVRAMASVKMNVLHFGLSNNQGFRVESKRFPRLHKAASNGQYYTQDEIRDLIDYAARHGVRIVPEFNMPGHSTAFLVAYTELAAGTAPAELRKTSGVFDDEMNPASSHVEKFVRNFVEEMAALFTDGFWHFGGDEVTGKSWDIDPTITAYKKEHGLADNKELQAHFTGFILEVLEANDKRGIGWEEVVHGKPPSTTFIQPWIKPSSDAIFTGYPVIASTGYYLDHFLWAEEYAGVPPKSMTCSNTIVGAEACIWSEVMNADNVEAIIWPGALGLANLFWSEHAAEDNTALIARTQERFRTLGWADLEAPDRLAARLCGGTIAPSVATLRDYVAPLVYYFVQDRAANPHDVMEPFSRLIETLLPETAAMHRLKRDADAALAGKPEALKAHLAVFKNLGARFRAETKDLPGLHENQSVADMLEAIALATLQALDGTAPHIELPLDALMPPAANDLDAILDAVKRRRKADLPLLLKETNIPVLPALRQVLASHWHETGGP